MCAEILPGLAVNTLHEHKREAFFTAVAPGYVADGFGIYAPALLESIAGFK